jgi:hypothetical protein
VPQSDLKITSEDVGALYKILDLIKEFSDKNPIRKEKIDYIAIKAEVKSIGKEVSEGKQQIDAPLMKLLKKLRSIIKREVHPDVFFIVAGHGGIIIDDIGFCEFDDPRFALTRLLERMKLAIETNMPYNIEVAMCCLDWLKKRYPEDMSKFIQLFKAGKFEIINPTFSQPYSLIVGAESNIKQFEYGLRILKQLGLPGNLYYCSEVALHPQIPQLLKGFNIKYGSLRTRLLGTCPTTHSGHINWIGLDDTSIESLTDISGMFNGEIWHGTFFKELPGLLFQAVARPFLNHIIYSSLEDFIMPLPYHEEIWRLSRFSDLFGRFVLSSDIFQFTELDGAFKFTRDSFFLGHYIFNPTDLFLHNKNSEISLISAEIVNSVLGLFDEESEDALLEDLWAKLLLTQAHDNYAVPDMHAGDYSANQLSREEYKQLTLGSKKLSISKLSIEIQKEIQLRCNSYILQGLEKLGRYLGTQSDIPQTSVLVFNFSPTSRCDIISIPIPLEHPSKLQLICNNAIIPFQYRDSKLEFISEIPPLGYKIYSLLEHDSEKSPEEGKFFYTLTLSNDKKTLHIQFNENQVYELTFQSAFDYELSIGAYSKSPVEERFKILGQIKDTNFELEVVQYAEVNRLEFVLESNSLKDIVLIPSIPIVKSIINYPFGIEETHRSRIETLDFLWLQGERQGLIFLIKNSPRFIINRKNFTIHNLINSKGRFEFVIAVTEENALHTAVEHLNAYQYRLFGIKLPNNYEFSKTNDSFLSITKPLTLINLWRRQGQTYLRIFNPSQQDQPINLQGILVKTQLHEIDLNYNDLRLIINGEFTLGPWKISNLKL